jgi:competence protein ComEC
MKVPAMAITAAFTCGIAVGLWSIVAREATSPIWLVSGFAVAFTFLLSAIVLSKSNRLIPAAVFSVLSWIALGVVAAWIGQQPLPAEHILNLLEHGQVDLRQPLRWYGQMRDEAQRLPWGMQLEIDLTGVEYENRLVRTRGGLRLTFAARASDPPLPELHAGEGVSMLCQAKRPQVFRDEGAFDRRAYLATQNIDLIGTLRAPELIRRTDAARQTVNVLLARTRRNLRDTLDSLFLPDPQVGSVLRSMLLGDRSFVERQESTNFQKTGVFHVLVIAGLHVGALAGFLFWIGRKLRLRPGWTIAFTLTALLAYVAVIEQRPPVVRAALMAAIVVVGRLFYRRLDVLNSAAIAALILLVARPTALKDSSFQLTFLAIGCIGGLALPWLERTVQPFVKALRGWRDVTRDAAHQPIAAQFRIDLRSLVRWVSSRAPSRFRSIAENALVTSVSASFRVWELLVLTLVLQIGMLPLMARDFHRVTLSAPMVNLLAVPLTGIVVPLGFLTLTSALIAPAIGKVFAVPLGWLTLLLIRVVEWFANFPRWSYRIPGPPVWLMAAFFMLVLVLGLLLRLTVSWRRVAARSLCGGLAACSVVIATYPFAPDWWHNKLELTVLDVGQGDSLLVVSPHGRTMLIDGGGAFGGFSDAEEQSGVDPGEDAVSPYLWSRGFQKLDFVTLTHAHQDHLGGLLAVLENFRVGELWIGREVSLRKLARLEQVARSRNTIIKHQVRGSVFQWDGVEGQFLWPTLTTDGAAPPNNDDSLVLRLRLGERTMLLPGDAEKDAEGEILAENDMAAMRADILKVAHHGSKNSSMPDFLEAVSPQLAIISAGEDNPYGHPSPELLKRLDNAHIRVLRTDQNGAVQVLTDGQQIEIRCYVPCKGFAEPLRAQAPNFPQKHEQK